MRDDVCRDIARWGEPYNPYKSPHSPAQKQQDSPVAEATQPKPQVPQQSGAVSSSVQRATRSLGTFPESPPYQTTTYTPPTTRDL